MVIWYIYTIIFLFNWKMNNNEKQIHVRLQTELFKKLKVKCVHEDTSMQEYLAGLITENLALDSVEERVIDEKKGQNTGELEPLWYCPIFYGVDRGEVEKIAGAAVLLHFKKGEVIVREGDIPTFRASAGRDLRLEIAFTR